MLFDIHNLKKECVYKKVMEKLTTKRCVACEGAVQPLTRKEFTPYLKQIKEWNVIKNKKIEREFKVKNFKEALNFINKIGEIAEQEHHHPDIFLYNWNNVKITSYTHAIQGLFVNDFIVAAKIDKAFEKLS